MVSGSTLEKLGLHVVLPYSGTDWTRFWYVIGFENIRIHRPPVIGFVADLFFSTLESGFKNIRIRCRIRRMRVDGSRIRKEKVAVRKYPDSPFTRYWIRCGFIFSTLVSGLKNTRIRCRIRRMRVDGSRIRNEKVADSKIYGYVGCSENAECGVRSAESKKTIKKK